METATGSDLDLTCREIHRVVLELAESLDETQLRWRPDGHATSIGFHLWHLARESDYLRSAIVERVEELGPDFGPPAEIWAREGLAERWAFPAEAATTVGTGLSDEIAASLPIPAKAELIDYLRHSYADLEAFTALLDERDPSADGLDPAFALRVGRIRLNLLNFLTHDCRHLGMMEVLKGLQTGFGSATEMRPDPPSGVVAGRSGAGNLLGVRRAKPEHRPGDRGKRDAVRTAGTRGR